MRTNLPVSNIECPLPEGQCLVSKTDLKGRIVYCNAAFVEVSGFAEAELMGAPHNIVRHPDMPREAFADLWQTLQQGLPWTGMIKNRRKNGDHYWVLANVTPVREDGEIVGYMSVRSKPARRQIDEAERIYRRFAGGQARGLRITGGAVVRGGWVGRLRALHSLPLGLRFGIGAGMLCLLLAGGGYAAFQGEDGGLAGEGIAALNGIGVLIALYLWHLVRATILQPLHAATDVARAIAGGDLRRSFEPRGNDDMAQLLGALRQMNINLQATIGDVRSSVASIAVATREIAAGNMDLSERTESQASSLEQTASSMEQLAATVKQNTDNAAHASALSSSSSEVAVQGGAAVRKVIATMEEIHASAQRISEITALIDGIAFQTNILALNASVEAARAGEQGRGFAVVAAEVRHLAQRSAEAAKSIKALTTESADKAAAGTVIANEAGDTMEKAVASSMKVREIVNDIALASREQNLGIDQVNQAVTALDRTTQQNAALVEQAAAAAANLEEQAARLSRTVAVFRLDWQPRRETLPVLRPVQNATTAEPKPALQAPMRRLAGAGC